ncbi:MAG: 3-oxoacid CoA-transferase subunit A [Pseudomonas sp.]
MINKVWPDALSAVADIPDGAVVGIGGFGNSGVPTELIDALIEHGPRELTVVSNNAGGGEVGVARLLEAGLVAKIVCSFPRAADSYVFDGLYRSGKLQLELVPQGTLAERLRAAGAGIGGFFTPTAFGTALADGKETRRMNGRDYVLELPLHLDYALVKAEQADRWGNLVYRKLARNFGPVMATAARCTVASIAELVPLGEIDPEGVVTPNVFVHRMVLRDNPQSQELVA